MIFSLLSNFGTVTDMRGASFLMCFRMAILQLEDVACPFLRSTNPAQELENLRADSGVPLRPSYGLLVNLLMRTDFALRVMPLLARLLASTEV